MFGGWGRGPLLGDAFVGDEGEKRPSLSFKDGLSSSRGITSVVSKKFVRFGTNGYRCLTCPNLVVWSVLLSSVKTTEIRTILSFMDSSSSFRFAVSRSRFASSFLRPKLCSRESFACSLDSMFCRFLA